MEDFSTEDCNSEVVELMAASLCTAGGQLSGCATRWEGVGGGVATETSWICKLRADPAQCNSGTMHNTPI